jgi:hypothetical protein
MDKQVLGSPRFVHRAGALAGLAGIVCGSVASGMLTHPVGRSFCVTKKFHLPAEPGGTKRLGNAGSSAFKRGCTLKITQTDDRFFLPILMNNNMHAPLARCVKSQAAGMNRSDVV